jgi:hypothetical protein
MDMRDLYGLPLDRFTEERNTRAKELRREGRSDEAAELAKLRKPSVAAWAVNQLVRTQRAEIAALFDAGDALRQAQADLLAKRGDADALRRAVDAERTAGDQLTKKARGLLGSEGHELTPAVLERVSDTLHAAALDEDARAQVKDGCLHRELRHVGLGATGLASAQASPGSSRTRAPRKGTRGKAATPSPAKSTSAPDRNVERKRAETLRAARKAEADARRVADRAARELQTAQQRRDRAADSLADTEDALTAARKRAEEAALAHQRARRALEGG